MHDETTIVGIELGKTCKRIGQQPLVLLLLNVGWTQGTQVAKQKENSVGNESQV